MSSTFRCKAKSQGCGQPPPSPGFMGLQSPRRTEIWNDGTRQTARRTRNRAGDGWSCADSTRENELTAGATARGYCVSREEHHFLFSAGDFGAGECGAFHSALCGRTVEEVRYFFFRPYRGSRPCLWGTTHGLRCGLHSLLAAFFHGYVLASLAMTAGEFVCRCLRLIRGDKVFI